MGVDLSAERLPLKAAARLLGVHRSTLYRAIERIDVDTH